MVTQNTSSVKTVFVCILKYAKVAVVCFNIEECTKSFTMWLVSEVVDVVTVS